MRVYVSGSRFWRWREVIWRDLDAVWERVQREARGDPPEMTVVQGEARGADQHAHEWYELVGPRSGGAVTEDPFPAQWKLHGRRAGMIRNRLALESGIDVAFFYILDESSGAMGALKMARAMGIERYIRLRGKCGEFV